MWLKTTLFACDTVGGGVNAKKIRTIKNALLARFCVCLFCATFTIQKSGMSIKFPPAILVPEMAAQILWGAWHFFRSFCWKTAMPNSSFQGGGGGWGFLEGGVEVRIFLLWAWGFFEL